MANLGYGFRSSGHGLHILDMDYLATDYTDDTDFAHLLATDKTGGKGFWPRITRMTRILFIYWQRIIQVVRDFGHGLHG